MTHPSDTAGLIEEQALVCEQHPGTPWPHDDCAGPGVPIKTQIVDTARQITKRLEDLYGDTA